MMRRACETPRGRSPSRREEEANGVRPQSDGESDRPRRQAVRWIAKDQAFRSPSPLA